MGANPATGNAIVEIAGSGLPSSTGQKTAQGSTSVVDALLSSVALVTPPANLLASNDTIFTFASQVRVIQIQNRSATAVGIEWDAAATAGSYQIDPGQTQILPFSVTALHMYSVAATPVNGSTGLNIVL